MTTSTFADLDQFTGTEQYYRHWLGIKLRDLNWSFSTGSLLPYGFHTPYPHGKDSLSPVTPQVSNETGGVQTPNVAEADSLNRSGARGKSFQW